ncbi:MAG: ribosome silencing factor [Ruminococcaceae bacterium]|nr:ribosome silencing factor [Oscillospiraceae bacterium]
MTAEELANVIKEILEDKKAIDIEVIEISQKTILADYFVIASGTSVTHVKSLADEVSYQLKEKYQMLPKSVDGESTSRWVLLDYGDVVVHIFHPEDRAFYSLEKLWQASRQA